MNKVKEQPNFLTVIEGFDGEITMEDLIEQANQS